VPEFLVLRNSARHLDPYPSSIEIRFSSDNRLFEIADSMNDAVDSYTVDNKEILVVKLSGSPARYTKLRYSNSDTGAVFKNRLASLIEVYGKRISK
jgi:hypothetical protein